MANGIVNTINLYPISGGTDFRINFEYLARRFVVVTLISANGDRQQLVMGRDYRFLDAVTIQTVNAYSAPWVNIELRRVTSATQRLVDFRDGSILRAIDLNVSQLQAIHIAEESNDLITLGLEESIDAANSAAKDAKDARADANSAKTIAQTSMNLSKRTLRVNDTEPEMVPLPSKEYRAGKVQGYDGNGLPTMMIPPTGGEAAIMAELSGTHGENLIGGFNSMDAMKASKPHYVGERVRLNQYYDDRPRDGGGIFMATQDTTRVDDGGYVNVRHDANWVWVRQHEGQVTLWDGGCRTGSFDCGPMIQNIDKLSGLLVLIPRGSFLIRTPVKWKANAGIRLEGMTRHNQGSVLVYAPLPGATGDEAMLEMAGTDGAGYNFGGGTFRDFMIVGQGSVAHGFRIKHAGYIRMDGVKIENFKGHGLELNHVMDSEFNYLEVQMCGRTDGDYAVAADCIHGSGNLKTILPAIYVWSEVADKSNMLRFNGGQWEHNFVSPTIRFDGGIGFWVNQIHMEHRQGPLAAAAPIGDFLWAKSCDVYVSDIQASQVEWNITTQGWGVMEATRIGRSGGIRHFNRSTGEATWRLTNCRFIKTTLGPVHRISAMGVDFGNTDWTYPGGNSQFVGCIFKDLTVDNNGSISANEVGTEFMGCKFQSITLTANADRLRFTSGGVSGAVNAMAIGSRVEFIDMNVKGEFNVNTKNGVTRTLLGEKMRHIDEYNAVQSGTNDPAFPMGSTWRNVAASTIGEIAEQTRVPTGWAVTKRIGLPVFNDMGHTLTSYTVGALPAASTHRLNLAMATGITVQEAGISSGLVYSDGANWRMVHRPNVVIK